MLRTKLLTSILLTITLLSASAGSAFAVTTPAFPLCVNPQGQIKVTYADGVHGVPGDSTTYTGKDTVYTLDEATLTQCLCTVNGSGIQTNWWKISSLTQNEKNILINQGWIYIPDGSAWGLQAAPYLAQNSSFACGSTTTTSTGNPGGPGDGLGCSTHDCSGNQIGGPSTTQAVLGISTQAVLGLASTGNIMFILTVFSLGIVLLGGGIISAFKKKQ